MRASLEHLEERLDARRELADVLGRVVGLDLQDRDAGLLERLLDA